MELKVECVCVRERERESPSVGLLVCDSAHLRTEGSVPKGLRARARACCELS